MVPNVRRGVRPVEPQQIRRLGRLRLRVDCTPRVAVCSEEAALDDYDAEQAREAWREVSARGPTWEELEAWCKRNSIGFDRMRRGIEKQASIREAEESLAEMKAIAELLSSLSGREWWDAQKRWDAAKRRYDNAVAAFQRTEKAHGE